jgi:subtilisin family serine protease
MGTRRVIVFGLHEHEIAAAERAIPDGEVTESFVVGDADDAAIAELRNQGLIVQEVASGKVDALLPSAPRQATFGAGAARGRPTRSAKTKPTHLYRLTLKGPLLESWRRAIERAGATIVESLPGFGLHVRINPSRVKALRKLKFLAGPPEPLATAAATVPRFDATTIAPSGATTPIEPYDILLTSEKARAKLVKWLQPRNVPVAGAQGKKVRIYALRESPILDEIRGLTDLVDRLEVFIPPKLFNDVARRLLGIDSNATSNPPPAPFPWTGEGELVAVADTGIDETHPDFKGRIQKVVARGRPGDASDPNGHGTHVAGSVLGDGSASRGEIKGTAPKAKLFFQSLLDKDDGLGGLPFELGALFEEAYAAGARIHNNSWGAATESTYRITSNEVDEFVRKRPDMLVVIAAGNEGSAFQPRNAKKGYVDWLSIGSPATCKNALTVGASRSSRAKGAYAPHTYGELWGDTYPDLPIAAAPVSGDSEAMGAFSSRGPCDEYRIKPDVVAPGTDVLSCRSVRAPLRNFWGGHTNPKYAFMGGTSMATPLVTGCAAAVRQYYMKERTWKPSAALLKATLINGTRRLTGQDSVADYPDLPNYHQGFGAIFLPDTVPSPRNPSLKLEFFDNWNTPASHFKVTGRRLRFKVDVAAGGQLRICMAYTDHPGRGVQNNLDLFLEVAGSPNKLFGNPRVPRGFNGPDPNNNVEVIRIDNAPAGTYMIAIVASNILHPPQDVALVVTGRLTGPLTAI